MTTYINYSVVQAFDGDSSRDVRRTFSDILTAREAFSEAVATQKVGSVTLFGEKPEQQSFDPIRMFDDEFMPDVLDFRGFDADSPSYDFERKEFIYA